MEWLKIRAPLIRDWLVLPFGGTEAKPDAPPLRVAFAPVSDAKNIRGRIRGTPANLVSE